MDPKAAFLPEDDNRWETYDRFDLTKDVEAVKKQLNAIKDIEAYINGEYWAGGKPPTEEIKKKHLAVNVEILRTAVLATEALCPKLQFITFQTGGKSYGMEYFPNVPCKAPFKDTDPRVPEPYASMIFYYAQADALKELAQGKSWNFVEIRPDAIVGFVPNGNVMNFGECLGLWLAMYRDFEGEGAEVPYPGPEKAWTARHTDSSQIIVARQHIWSSLNPEKVGSGNAYNCGDGVNHSWSDGKWEGVCKLFGLTGVGPREGAVTGVDWIMSKQGRWEEWEDKHGLKKGVLARSEWWFMAVMMGYIEFDREYDLSSAGNLGFHETIDTVKGYEIAFEKMKKGRVIP